MFQTSNLRCTAARWDGHRQHGPASRSSHHVEEKRETMRPWRVAMSRNPTGEATVPRAQHQISPVRSKTRASVRAVSVHDWGHRHGTVQTQPCMHVHCRLFTLFSCCIVRSITARAHQPHQAFNPSTSSRACSQPADQLVSTSHRAGTQAKASKALPRAGQTSCEMVSGGLSRSGHPATRSLASASAFAFAFAFASSHRAPELQPAGQLDCDETFIRPCRALFLP